MTSGRVICWVYRHVYWLVPKTILFLIILFQTLSSIGINEINANGIKNSLQCHLCYFYMANCVKCYHYLLLNSLKKVFLPPTRHRRILNYVVEFWFNCRKMMKNRKEWIRVLAVYLETMWVSFKWAACDWLKLLLLTARKLLELLLQGDGGVVGAKDLGCQAIHQLL